MMYVMDVMLVSWSMVHRYRLLYFLVFRYLLFYALYVIYTTFLQIAWYKEIKNNPKFVLFFKTLQ